MAILQVVSVYDAAVTAFGRPVFVPAVGVAVRGFGDEVNRPDGGDMSKHPSDFTLYHLGHFDDATGQFSLLPMPERLANGANFKTEV